MFGCRLLLKLPLFPLLIAAVLLGLAPYAPEPHLFEKLRWLFTGTLHRGLDIFDLLLHGTPIVLLLMRLCAAGICRTKKDHSG
jgi:hypothetical protein